MLPTTSLNLVETPLVENGTNHTNEERVDDKQNTHKFIEWWSYVHISLFAIFGCLIRLGIDYIAGKLLNIEDSETVIFVSFFSNILGSFFMGVLVSSGLKKQGELKHFYIGISTGLCGSITTYSKWNQQVSMLLIGETGTGVVSSQLTGLSAIYIGLVTFLCSFQGGKDTSIGHRKTAGETTRKIFNNRKWRYKTNHTSLVLLILILISLIISCVFLSYNSFAFSLLLSAISAPFGASLRFLLGTYNGRHPSCITNKIIRKLPLGTLYANFVGSFLMAISHVLITWSVLTCSSLAILRGFQSGFVACLTTVSTFMSEVSSLRSAERNMVASYVYMTITIIWCQFIGCMTNGVSFALFKNTDSYNSTISTTAWLNSMYEHCN